MSYPIYSTDPVIPLRDSEGNRSVIKLERVVALTSDAGTSTAFDSMLSTFVGGFDVDLIPITNRFKLSSIPVGAYNIYLYASPTGITTDFYVSVNSSAPVLKSATGDSGGSSAFVVNENYVVYENIVVSEGDVVSISASGALAGLQLLRI